MSPSSMVGVIGKEKSPHPLRGLLHSWPGCSKLDGIVESIKIDDFVIET